MFSDCFGNIVKILDVSRKTITPKDSDLVLNGIKNFENHSSIWKIKDWMHPNLTFALKMSP